MFERRISRAEFEMDIIKTLDMNYRLNGHRNIDLVHWFMSTMK